jgi:hypothetical protein
MATEIYPSSFRCDCGEDLGFSESTIREMKKMSKNKQVRLGEGKHTILFYKGTAKEIICPKLKKCAITDWE